MLNELKVNFEALSHYFLTYELKPCFCNNNYNYISKSPSKMETQINRKLQFVGFKLKLKLKTCNVLSKEAEVTNHYLKVKVQALGSKTL